jgi:hypothetical protein
MTATVKAELQQTKSQLQSMSEDYDLLLSEKTRVEDAFMAAREDSTVRS